LKNDIVQRIRAVLKKQATTQEIASASPMKSTHGLQAREVAALAFVMVNGQATVAGVSGHSVSANMRRAGYTRAATQLGLIRLNRIGLVEIF
jgi:hypothetical protein